MQQKSLKIYLFLFLPLITLSYSPAVNAGSLGFLPLSCNYTTSTAQREACVNSEPIMGGICGQPATSIGDTIIIGYDNNIYGWRERFLLARKPSSACWSFVSGTLRFVPPPLTPIVFDLDQNGFSFTDVNIDPVQFDLDADGELELTGWTNSNADDAFLGLDRNENRIIDDGGELFGNRTKLLSGEFAEHGYEALAELDLVKWGGNGDGILDHKDRNYQKLILWKDSNHDGVSDPNEVKNLRSQGIISIDLKYYYDPIKDGNGNILVWFGFAMKKHRGHTYDIQTTDVVFDVVEIEP